MPLFLQIPHTVLRQSDTVFCLMISFWTILLPVLPFIPWLIRPDRPFVTALPPFANAHTALWRYCRGSTAAYVPWKKYKTWHGICFMLSVQRKKSSFRVQKT